MRQRTVWASGECRSDPFRYVAPERLAVPGDGRCRLSIQLHASEHADARLAMEGSSGCPASV